MHGANDVLFCWLTHGVLLVVGQDNHVFPSIAEIAIQIGRHIFYVVYTAS